MKGKVYIFLQKLKRAPHALSYVFSGYKGLFFVLILLGFLSAMLDGIGINMIIPFLSFLTGGGALAGTDFITTATRNAFVFFHVPFAFRNLVIFMGLLIIGRAIAMILFSYMRARIVATFVRKEMEAVFSATLEAQWSYLLSLKQGYIHNTIFWDIKRASGLLDVFAQAAQSWSGCVVYLVIAFSISPGITAITVVVGAVFMLLFRPLVLKSQTIAAVASVAEKEFSHHMTEHLSNLKSVKISGQTPEIIKKGTHYLDKLKYAYEQAGIIQSAGTVLIQPLAFLFLMSVFFLSYTSGSFNLAAFAATFYLIQKIFVYIQSAQATFHGISELMPYAENVSQYKRASTHSYEDCKTGDSFSFASNVSFEHVAFSYPNGTEVFSDLSFTIQKGQSVAVIGSSGSGKTTVADLLLRLFTPSKGRIAIDGVSLEEVDLNDWRRHIGYVTQEAFLLHDSIAENIRFYRSDITDADIEHAIAQANLLPVIESLPAGKDTVVGDRGVMLSGGQRQRIALARALAGKPSILVLDEATSALDTESERLVQDSIEALYGTITVVVIAHRLSTIEKADNIIVLDKGEVIEQGTPQELRARPNSYYGKHST